MAVAKAKKDKDTGVTGPVEGTCDWFNLRKGYGFFQTPEGDSVFVHISNLVRDENRLYILPKKDGGRVRFSYGLSDKDGHEDDLEVKGKVEVIDRYVPESKS